MSGDVGSAFKDSGPVATMLADGKRLHLQHGPIDLVIQADGARDEISAAYRQVTERFRTVLVELVEELPTLRSPTDSAATLTGPVARRMRAATLPHAETFITPMAAVAGAVADEMLASLTAGRDLSRAYVNNGGDIALYLAPGESYIAALVSDPTTAQLAGQATIDANDLVCGIATSGRHGRSHSLGIADAVTVLAHTAAEADAAATMIANAVDLPGSPRIERVTARELYPDSDLGARLVTVDVQALTSAETGSALDAGQEHAQELQSQGLILSAFLALGGETRVVGAILGIERQSQLERTG
ncbi:MAG: UPF0280 family protein [Alphaproteobacteria bacterium]|jgi:uncharacterized protein|nr:UPF0280 family protein [Alphaproteobacteria bacterium]